MSTFRITINGSTSKRWAIYPGIRWTEIADYCEQRGGRATLERQDILNFETSDDCDEWLAGLGDASVNFIRIKNRIICPWIVIAELNYDQGEIIMSGSTTPRQDHQTIES